MKTLFTFIALLLANVVLSQTRQDTITLKLEMVSPSGVIDESTYLRATLKNETSDFRFLLQKKELFPRRDFQSGIMVVEVEHKDGKIEESDQMPMFDFEYVKVIVLDPGKFIQGRIALRDELGLGNGVFGPMIKLSTLQSYKRIRIKLLSYLDGAKFANGKYYNQSYTEFYSNWVDLSDCDFSRIAKPDK